MREKEATPPGVWQYKASWRTTTGSVVIVLLLFVFVLLVLALAGPRFAPGFLLPAATLGWFAWLAGKPLFTGDWVVRIGPRGISSYLLNGRTVPWRDVRDVAVETVQGHASLVVHISPDAVESLRKTKRWLNGRKAERRIALSALRKDQAAEAIAAATGTFAARAGEHAAAAMEAHEQEARAEAAFEQELLQHTGAPWALYLVVALNVGVWVLNLTTGMSAMRPATEDLFRWGAISAWAVSRDHEFWRLLTGTFLHGGAVHLFMNMLGLWGAGKLLNRMYGNPQFLLVYLLSALAGASASLHFSALTAVSVGASGAVFGVVGALVVAVRRRREHLPKALVKSIMGSEAVFLLYALLNGFSRQGIDNAAHVGGLLAGAAMGLVLAGVVDATGERARRLRAAAISAVVVLAIGLMVATTPEPRVDHARLFMANSRLQQIMPRIGAANAAMQKDVQDARAGRTSGEQLAVRLEAVHLPALRKLHGELQQVPRAYGDPRSGVTDDIQALTARAIEGTEIELRGHRGESRVGDAERAEVLKREIEGISRRMKERTEALKAQKKG